MSSKGYSEYPDDPAYDPDLGAYEGTRGLVEVVTAHTQQHATTGRPITNSEGRGRIVMVQHGPRTFRQLQRDAILLAATLSAACQTTVPEVQAPPRAEVDRLLSPETLPKLERLSVTLQPHEYIVPDAAVAAYAKALRRSNFMGETTAMAAQISRDRLAPPKTLEIFRTALLEAGFQGSQQDVLERVFRSPHVIVVAERAVKDGEIQRVLAHERFHRAMKALPSDLYQHMMDVADALKAATKPGTEDFLLEESDPRDSGFIMMAARTGSREEIFAYMADGKFTAAAEERLRALSPRAHLIFQQLRTLTR